MSQNARINNKCTIILYVHHPKKTHEGEFTASQEDCLDPVHSGRMVLGTVRQEAGAHERWPKGLKTKQAWGGGGALGSSPLRLYGSRDGQAVGWTL